MIFFLFLFISLQATAATIMINPHGDVLEPGRTVGNGYERTITLSCALAIQKKIKDVAPHHQVILTRGVGDRIPPLYNATFANRSQADLFISLHCCSHRSSQPSLTWYLLSYAFDAVHSPRTPFFIPYDLAHCVYKSASQMIAKQMVQQCSSSAAALHGPYHLPCAPLLAVAAPAMAIEMAISDQSEWQLLASIIATALITVLEKL